MTAPADARPTNVVRAVAATLRQRGIRDLFGVLGSGNLALVGAAVDAYGMRYHALRHEAAAVAAADAYARVTGRVGMATVTHGPGLTHAASAIVEAAKSSVPVLIGTSSVSRAAPHRNQAIDQVALVRSLGATPFTLAGAADLPDTVERALAWAESRNQPVVLILPEDLHDEPAPAVEPGPTSTAVTVPVPAIDLAAVEHAVRLLSNAARPVVLAGRGAMRPETLDHLREIGRCVGALLFTTLPAKDRFAGDEFDAGICGSFGIPWSLDAAARADVVLVVGSSLSSWTTRHNALFADAAVIRCDSDTALAGRGEAVFLGGDGSAVTSSLASRLRSTDRPGYRTADNAAALRAAREHLPPDESDATGSDPRHLLLRLGRLLPEACSVVVDGGHFSGWPAMFIPTPAPSVFLYAHGYQCVGLALGNLAGVAIGTPTRLPVAFVGDGGLLMSLGELHAIAELGVPALVVVLDDGAYGAEYHQTEPGLAELTLLNRTDFAATARALGGRGISVRQLSDLDALSSWLAAPAGLCLVDCRISRRIKADWLPGRS